MKSLALFENYLSSDKEAGAVLRKEVLGIYFSILNKRYECSSMLLFLTNLNKNKSGEIINS